MPFYPHMCTEFDPNCFRCVLSRDEVALFADDDEEDDE